MSNLLKPSQVDTSQSFIGSSLHVHELEEVARTVTEMEQALAFVAGKDEWLPFRGADYEEYRRAIEPEPPLFNHKRVIRFMRGEGLFRISWDGLMVTDNFLDVVVQFKKPERATDPMVELLESEWVRAANGTLPISPGHQFGD